MMQIKGGRLVKTDRDCKMGITKAVEAKKERMRQEKIATMEEAYLRAEVREMAMESLKGK